MSTEPPNHLMLCRPLLHLPSIFPSTRVFSNESTLHIKWPKYWSFSFSISPFSEYSGLISFRMDWLDLLAVQGTLKSLFQHHSLKTSIFWCSAFFMVQFSHSYMITGKTIALTIWIFVNKLMFLLFNMLSSLGFSCSVGWWFWYVPVWLIWVLSCVCYQVGWGLHSPKWSHYMSVFGKLSVWVGLSWYTLFLLHVASQTCFHGGLWVLRTAREQVPIFEHFLRLLYTPVASPFLDSHSPKQVTWLCPDAMGSLG